MSGNVATTSGELRAHNRVRLLRAVHDCGASWTRSRLTRELALARGTASVLVGGLAEDGLLHEGPAPEPARGRPTLVPGPHPRGPIVLAADVREDAWELAACELGGRMTVLAVRAHDGTPEGAFRPLGAAMREHQARYGARVVGAGVAVPGPVREGGLADVARLRWRSVDVPALLDLANTGASPATALTDTSAGPAAALLGPTDTGASPATPVRTHAASDAPGGGGVFLRVGNDTAFAGLAEARRGLLRGVHVGLHLHVDFDLGGVLIVGGQPLGGAGGMGAEFGHMPLTGGGAPCACGASGCWGPEVGSDALLRHAGLPRAGGREQAERLLARAAVKAASAARTRTDDLPAHRTGDRPHDRPGDQAAGQAAAVAATAAVARVLGRGVAALVNAHDPEVVTLSGLGADLYDQASAVLMEACVSGMMTIRRERPPRVIPSALRRRGSLLGAMESAFDAFLTPEGLATWPSIRK